MGTGAEGLVRDGSGIVVLVGSDLAGSFASFLVFTPNSTAVVAAPTAADAPAMIASVTFDIDADESVVQSEEVNEPYVPPAACSHAINRSSMNMFHISVRKMCVLSQSINLNSQVTLCEIVMGQSAAA